MSDFRPRLALTVGDPRGIGPEIISRALGEPDVRKAADYVLVGPTGTAVPVADAVGAWPGEGADAALAGRLAGAAIDRAVQLALRGEVHGIVTAPIDKRALLLGGYDYPGHTEMLAALTGRRTAMMLASDRLRVVLATTHLALRDVPDAVTADAISVAVSITREGLATWFGLRDPRLVLCALNPHAGDGGRFGHEDDEVLAPVARRLGVAGPLPADTVFVRALRGEFDAVIAPYHDVGMTAIKVASFGSAVNITLGLPFARTSPDHGTALDIAGQGVADAGSMIAAVLTCAAMVRRQATVEG